MKRFVTRPTQHSALLALVLLSKMAAQAQGLQWGPVIDCAPEDAGALRPRIAINASGEPVVLWSNAASNACFAAVGQGAGFGPAQRLNPDGTELAAADWQGPSIAAAGDAIWAVYKGLPEDTAPCYLVGSTDGGMNWNDTLRVDPYDGLVSRFPVVAVTPDGAPIVEYMQFTSGYLEPRHVVRSWMDGSFLPPVPISAPFAPGEVCDCCTGEVATAEGQVCSLYRNAGGNIRVIWGAASTAGGASFPTGALLDTTGWFLGACPSSGPDLYFTGDSIRYVWMSGEANGSKVYIGSAHAATLAMGPQGNVSPGQPQTQQQNFPRIAGGGDTLGVVWEQFQGGSREVLFSWSVTGPSGLSAPDTVNIDLAGQQRTPDIAYADGAFHIVWSEPGTGHVRYRRAELTANTAINMPGTEAALHAWYDPNEDRLNITGTRIAALRLLDSSGRTLFSRAGQTNTISMRTFPAGCYLLHAVDERIGPFAMRFVKD